MIVITLFYLQFFDWFEFCPVRNKKLLVWFVQPSSPRLDDSNQLIQDLKFLSELKVA